MLSLKRISYENITDGWISDPVWPDYQHPARVIATLQWQGSIANLPCWIG